MAGDDGEGEQRERPAHPEHDADDEGEGEDVFEDGEDAGGEHFVERVDVGGDAGDEAADGVAVEEGDVLRWMWRKISRRRSNMIFWPVHCMR